MPFCIGPEFEGLETMKAIRTFNLNKRFARTAGYRDLLSFGKKQWVTAVDDVSLDVEEGEFFGLLGANGAGKTTLIKLLCCLVLPNSGMAEILGRNILKKESEVKKLVGLVSSEERSFYWRLTGRENLEFFAALYHLPKQKGIKRINELLEMLALSEKADIRFQNYSTGMRQKLAIARGLLSEPRVLFVDEPTRSLDPISAQAVRNFFKKIASEGKTVVLATHNLNEAEQLCNRVAIMTKGQVKALGTIQELRSVFQKQERCQLQVRHFSEEIVPRLARIEGVFSCRPICKSDGMTDLEIMISDRVAVLPQVLQVIVNNNIEVCDCQLKDLPLEDIFVQALHKDSAKEEKDGCSLGVLQA
jgi:ABC-2 type transport system ATP-binding protein